MSTETCYYCILKVNPKCTQVDLKLAFKKLALSTHPDKNPNGLRRFQEILHAYRVLSNPDKRQSYDRERRQQQQQQQQQRDRSSPEYETPPPPRRQKCPDLVRRLRVSLQELYVGGSKLMSVVYERVCEMCRPPPYHLTAECLTCKGKGVVRQHRYTEVTIEKGARDGHKTRYPGRGNERAGWETGDLVVVLKEEKHDLYKRVGSDLYTEVKLFLHESLCGFEKTIVTLDGRELLLSTEPGKVTPDGCMRYLEDEGMPVDLGSEERGKLIVKFRVYMPESLDQHTVRSLYQILGPRDPEPSSSSFYFDSRVTPMDLNEEQQYVYSKMFDNQNDD